MDTLRNGCFGKMDDLPVHTTANHHALKMDDLQQTFLQIILAAKLLVRHSSTSPKQQLWPLPPLLYKSFFYGCILYCIMYTHGAGWNGYQDFRASRSWSSSFCPTMHLGLEQAAHPEVNIGRVAVQLLQASQLLRVLRWYSQSNDRLFRCWNILVLRSLWQLNICHISTISQQKFQV